MSKDKAKDKKTDKTSAQKAEEIAAKLEELQKKYADLESKFLNLQLQYKELYDEYSFFRQRAQKREEEVRMWEFEKYIKFVIKVIEDLHKALRQMPEDVKKSSWWEGLLKLVEQFEKALEQYQISIEDAQGKEVDTTYHEPIGTKEVEKKLKGKVVDQYERGYIYKKGQEWEKVIQPAKVIVWR